MRRHEVAELAAMSIDYDIRLPARWADHEVEVRRSVIKRIDHPTLGPAEVNCEVLHIPDSDQRLVVYAAVPGGPSLAGLRSDRAAAR